MDIEYTIEELNSFLSRESQNKDNSSAARASYQTLRLYTCLGMDRVIEEAKVTDSATKNFKLSDALCGPLEDMPLYMADPEVMAIAVWRLEMGK